MSDMTRRDWISAGLIGSTVLAADGSRAEPAAQLAAPVEAPKPSITPFLTFVGKAEEAIHQYIGLFPNSDLLSMTRYSAEELKAYPPLLEPGAVKHALFRVAGQRIMAIDSPMKHAWSFTPAVSLFVQTNAEGVDRYFDALKAEGKVYMPVGEYPFSERFAWVEDRFGVSWQLMAGEILAGD